MAAVVPPPSLSSPDISQKIQLLQETKLLDLKTTTLGFRKYNFRGRSSGARRKIAAPQRLPSLLWPVTPSGFWKTDTPESLDQAKRALQDLSETNALAFNSLIRRYSSFGLLNEAIEVFILLLTADLTPDRFTFPPLLMVCSKVSALAEGAQLHGMVIKIGDERDLNSDLFVQNSLICFYSESEELGSAQKVFEAMPNKNVVSWTILIDGHARGGDPQEAVSLFRLMERRGHDVRPNAITMACVVSACAKLRDIELGREIHGSIVDSGVCLSIPLVNTIIDMYMKCKAFEEAEEVFNDQSDHNTVLWNTMISNYVRQGMAVKSLVFFRRMLLSGQRPDRISIVAAVSASTQLRDVILGKQLHGYILRNVFDIIDTVRNSVIDMYMKCWDQIAAKRLFDQMSNKTVVSWNILLGGYMKNGDIDSAFKVFETMPMKDLVSWNTMISSMVQESMFDEAITIFRELQLSSGFKPDRISLMAVASACGYLGASGLAKWVFEYTRKTRTVPLDEKLATAFVDMFVRCGELKIARQIFDELIIIKDVSAWTAVIGASAIEGDGKRALEIFEQMIELGVKPDGLVFVEVLTACSHGGLVDEGLRFFKTMSGIHGFTPQVFHYGCIVDLLGRAGHLDEAFRFLETMPIEPNDVIWGSLVAAGRAHGNLEIAEKAASKVFALNPSRTGARILLSNLYASAGRWRDVANVRLSLKEIGIKKPPGLSTVEVGGAVHEFTSGDAGDPHPEAALIDGMLEEIEGKLAAAGHVPDVMHVLLDVGNEEKERLLGRHSEKKAVAFALISTATGSPIRVMKNLRICGDCHSFMKMVSITYGREIAVRDNTRFHFFREGSCSCRDYW